MRTGNDLLDPYAELPRHETAMRSALYALANVPRGESRALDALNVFDDIEQLVRIASMPPLQRCQRRRAV